jgi:4-amino-4-deoxy-L-arabinose transferase-like glycosyltransferase
MIWGILAISAILRMLAIGRPLVGNFATKNIVYAMIARNWAMGRASLWYPTLDCLAGGQRSWHMLEFPVSAYLTGWLWKTLGGSLDAWGRATAAAFSVAAVALLYRFVSRRHGPVAGCGAALALGLAPVSVIYGQSFMLESSLLFFTVATFASLDRWLRGKRLPWLAIAALCLALLLLTKIYMAVMLLPLGAMIWRSSAGDRGRLACGLMVGLLACMPAAFWYAHAYRAATPGSATAARVYYSVRDSAEAHRFPQPLLRSANFYRRMLDDISGVVLTPVGITLLFTGLLDRSWRRYLPWLIAAGVLIVLLPRKFHEMNYYWLAVLPPLCIFVGLGWQVVAERLRPSRLATMAVVLVALLFSLRFTLHPLLTVAAEDRAVVAAGRATEQRTAVEEPVITMHGTTIDLLYYCRRPGWAISPDEPGVNKAMEEYSAHGARCLVVAGTEGDPAIERHWPGWEPVERGPGFCIYARK